VIVWDVNAAPTSLGIVRDTVVVASISPVF
jgi:hypothetical protein